MSPGGRLLPHSPQASCVGATGKVPYTLTEAVVHPASKYSAKIRGLYPWPFSFLSLLNSSVSLLDLKAVLPATDLAPADFRSSDAVHLHCSLHWPPEPTVSGGVQLEWAGTVSAYVHGRVQDDYLLHSSTLEQHLVDGKIHAMGRSRSTSSKLCQRYSVTQCWLSLAPPSSTYPQRRIPQAIQTNGRHLYS